MFLPRLISGIGLVLIALVTLIMGGPVLAIITCLISIIGYLELGKATQVRANGEKLNIMEVVGLVNILLYYGLIYFFDESMFMMIPIIVTFMGTMLFYVVKFPKYKAEQAMANVFNFLYAPIMLSFIFLTRELQYGELTVWLILISSWGSDTCAYVVGMLFGKKKPFPELSPKKSLEGCIGGIIGSGILGALYGFFVVESAFADQTITWIFAVICMIGSVMSQIGDLAASAIKRNYGIKDYGKLIPGHGGIMDRFDSMIVIAPCVYFMLTWFIKM